MDAHPNSVGRLAHLTDDEMLDLFDRTWKSLFHYSEQWSFRSRCSRIPRLGSRSNQNLYALVGFRLNLIAYLSSENKRESFRMGSSSDVEPMREGYEIWGKRRLIPFKKQYRGKNAGNNSF
ncbi:maturase K [Bienertia sinuspersici]